MAPELTSIRVAVGASTNSNNLPARLFGVWSHAASIERHFLAIDCDVHVVSMNRGETKASRVNLIKVTEDLLLKLGGKGW